MNDFLILLQAKLDEAKSEENINKTDIPKLQNQLDKLKVQVELDPKAMQKLADDIGKLVNQKIVISNIGIDSKSATKAGQDCGKQISQGISQGISSVSKSTEKVLRDFSELNDAKRKFVDGHDLISRDDIVNAEKLYDTVRKAFSEFGQVTVSKGSMNDGSLENMRVKIEQVNGEMKIARDFMLYFNERKNGFKLVDDDTIRTTEKVIQHLNEEKNIVNATSEEANAIKKKLAEQEKYYKKLGQATKEQIALEKQRITAGEKQLEILDAQSKRRDSRISYNEGQIDKNGLSDIERQRKLNDLSYAGQEKIDASFGKEIDKTVSNLSKLKEKWQEQGIYVDEFRSKVELLERTLNEINFGDVKGLNSFKEQISSLTVEAKQLSQIHEIQLLSNGGIDNDYDTQLAKLTGSFTRIGLKAEEIKEKTSGVTHALSELRDRLAQPFDKSNYDEIISLNQKLQTEFINSRNESARMNATMKMATDSSRLNNVNQIQKWADNNSRAMKKYATDINRIIAEMGDLSKVMSQADASRLLNEFKSIQKEAGKAGIAGMTAIDKIKKAVEKFGGWSMVTGSVTTLWNQLQRIPKEVYEIDTAMTNLYKVTDETSEKYTQFLDSASSSAHELGRSISSLVEQTANWAKLGFDIDTAAKLAEISSIYANVGEVDDATAVSDLVTAMKSFNIEASNAMTIVDSLNRLGNEFATDAKSLGEGLKNSASSMAVAGNDINQTLAILTGAGEITQNVNELSNGLRVVSMRLRGMKGELQAIGEEYEDIESISKIQTQIYNLTNGSVNIFKDDGSLKSTYDQLKEVSKVYFDLSDVDRANLTEIMFGKNRANQGVAILQAFQSGQIQKAYEASVNSAGSAMQEQERWLQSLEAKTAQFEAAFQSLSSTILDSGLLKWFVDFGTTSISSIEDTIKLLENINTFGGNIGSTFGNLGALSGLLMNKAGIGKILALQW